MTMFGSQWLANAGSTYEIEQSIRFNDDDTSYMQRTPGSAGNDHTWTFSVWVKRGSDIGDVNQQNGIVGASSTDAIGFYNDDLQVFTGDGSSGAANFITNAKFRDPSSWYHFVVRYDDTQSTNTNRVRIYVNGVQVTSFSTSGYPDQNEGSAFNTDVLHRVGANAIATTRNVDGYLAEIVMIDGTSLGPGSFGETNSTTGQWVPIDVSDLTYGTNGFRLKGQDSSALGDDTSGNGNDFASSGLAANDQMSDSPTNNHCTWNLLQTGTNITSLSNGNLVLSGTSGAAAKWMSLGTMAVSSGKWYYEVTSGGARIGAGFTTSGSLTQANLNTGPIDVAAETFVITNAGEIYYGTTDSGNTTPAFGSGVTMGFALDADAGKAWVTVNGSDWADSSSGTSGDPTDGSNPTWTQTIGTPVQPLCGDTSGGSFVTLATANFGQSAFAYTPPTGYKAWNTDNLPDPAIEYPPDYFTPYIYTGDDSGTSRVFTGVGFAPNLVWTKSRAIVNDHTLFDTVRGTGKYLSSSYVGAGELTNPSSGYLTAFGSDGYTFSDGSSGTNPRTNYNANSTYVSWNWVEGATPGFDIVSYTGNATARTIAHNLGVVPKMMIVKNRADTDNWAVYHASNTAAPATDYLVLNANSTTADDATVWNDTAPTSSVFSVGTGSLTNGNTEAMIAYVFAPVEGFSAFGSYVGNNNANGPMVNLGFQPSFIMLKDTSNAQGWAMYDTKRGPFNPVAASAQLLFANLSSASSGFSSNTIDIVSNGFKVRAAMDTANINNAVITYAAFAENPFKTANAR